MNTAINELCKAIKEGDEININKCLKNPIFTKRGRINGFDILGHTPLIKATMKRNLKLVNQLIELGCDLSIATRYKGLTPLHVASFNGFPEIVQCLCQNGGIKIVNLRNRHLDTPLHSACFRNREECVKILLEYSADKNALNSLQKRPIDLCRNEKIKSLLKKTRRTRSMGEERPRRRRRYKLISKISSGGFGSVYKAIDTSTKGIAACKKIQVNEKKFSSEAIEKEIAFYQNLSHRYVIKYLGWERKRIEFDDFFFIYQEYCAEGTIGEFFKKINSMERKLYCLQIFLKQILEGLSFLHSKNIVHRDIKPSNILINKDNCVKLTDFGTAKELCKNESMVSNMTYIGTTVFCAPEVVIPMKKRKFPIIAKAVDIWSLGITIMSLLIGNIWKKLNFQDDIQLIIFLSQLEQSPKIPDEIGNKEIRNFISNCIQLNPAKRPTADELLKHDFFNIEINFNPDIEESFEKQDDDDEMETDSFLNITPYFTNSK